MEVSAAGYSDILRMLDLIQKTYAQPITLDTLAAAIGKQPTYLGRLFRQKMGITVHESVTRMRLEQAAKLISAGVKVEAVALTVGYRSKKNFYIQFKRRFETTPQRYGRQRRITPATTSPVTVEAAGGTSRESTRAAAMSRHALGDRRLLQATQLALGFARATLQVARQRFAGSSVAMLLTDDVGRYVGANRAAALLTHYGVMELIKLRPRDLFSKAPAVDARCLWQAVQPTAGPSSNAVLRCKEGKSVSVHVMSVRNLLWGRPEMSSMLAVNVPTTAPGYGARDRSTG